MLVYQRVVGKEFKQTLHRSAQLSLRSSLAKNGFQERPWMLFIAKQQSGKVVNRETQCISSCTRPFQRRWISSKAHLIILYLTFLSGIYSPLNTHEIPILLLNVVLSGKNKSGPVCYEILSLLVDNI